MTEEIKRAYPVVYRGGDGQRHVLTNGDGSRAFCGIVEQHWPVHCGYWPPERIVSPTSTDVDFYDWCAGCRDGVCAAHPPSPPSPAERREGEGEHWDTPLCGCAKCGGPLIRAPELASLQASLRSSVEEAGRLREALEEIDDLVQRYAGKLESDHLLWRIGKITENAVGEDVPPVDQTWKGRAERLDGLLNTPELHDFAQAVVLEAAHQRERWGDAHDEVKAPEDWFWTLGYLGGKALHAAKAGDIEKAMHHTISSSALLNNWHRHLRSALSPQDPATRT